MKSFESIQSFKILYSLFRYVVAALSNQKQWKLDI